MKYRIVERRKTIFLVDHPDGEFGRAHPVRRSFEIETIEWPPKLVKSFGSFQAAKLWAKQNKFAVSEIA